VLTPSARERLDAFAAFLLEANAGLNLTAARDRAAVWEHIEDSLTLAALVRGPLVDIGSGGGFPAIPLAIVTGVPMTLIESLEKKARFLRAAAERFALPIVVEARRAEDAARDPALRERFACATARAVASGPSVLELTLPFLEIGGRALLQRGALDERERRAMADAALVLGARICEEVALDGERRRLVIVEKTAATSARFPRRAGIPAKRPLCLR
jgi:16S rRNA (guanine527-N7)-methyltransferase